MKMISYFFLLAVSTGALIAECPYETIDCAECCQSGHAVSSECCKYCNGCYMYNDQACAECKNYPK